MPARLPRPDPQPRRLGDRVARNADGATLPRESAAFHILPLLLYVLLAIVLTYPLILHLRTHIAGAGGDSLIFLWNFWWVNKALADPAVSLFYTDFLYYPVGASLALHTLSLFNGLLSVPLQSLCGLVGAYNVLVLLGFVLGGWGAYLLAWELTRHRLASIFAGIVFGFSPYHFSNAMADLNVASLQFLPFTLLYLVRWRRNGGLRDPLMAGLFLGLTALCSWYYLVFGAMAMILFGVVWLLRSKPRRIRRKTILGILLLAAIAGAVVAPAAIPMVRAAADREDFMNPGRQEAYSADLVGYALPSPYHPLFRRWVMPYYEKLSGNIFENTVSLGLLVIVLAVYASWGRLKSSDEDRLGWLVLGLTALVLSLGPTLQIGGKTLGKSGYLPYRWLVQSAPLVSHARVSSRFAVLVVSAASVLAAFGFRDLLARPGLGRSRVRRVVAVVLLFALLGMEFWVYPFPARTIPIPEFFREVARDGQDYAILGLPLREWGATVLAMYYQTAHGKRLLNGCVSRVPERAHAVLDEWEKDPLNRALLLRNRVRYIVLFAPEGIQPWHEEVMGVFSHIPWLIRLNLTEPQIVVYRVQWLGDSRSTPGRP